MTDKLFVADFHAYVVAPDRSAAWKKADEWAKKRQDTDGGLWFQALYESEDPTIGPEDVVGLGDVAKGRKKT